MILKEEERKALMQTYMEITIEDLENHMGTWRIWRRAPPTDMREEHEKKKAELDWKQATINPEAIQTP